MKLTLFCAVLVLCISCQKETSSDWPKDFTSVVAAWEAYTPTDKEQVLLDSIRKEYKKHYTYIDSFVVNPPEVLSWRNEFQRLPYYVSGLWGYTREYRSSKIRRQNGEHSPEKLKVIRHLIAMGKPYEQLFALSELMGNEEPKDLFLVAPLLSQKDTVFLYPNYSFGQQTAGPIELLRIEPRVIAPIAQSIVSLLTLRYLKTYEEVVAWYEANSNKNESYDRILYDLISFDSAACVETFSELKENSPSLYLRLALLNDDYNLRYLDDEDPRQWRKYESDSVLVAYINERNLNSLIYDVYTEKVKWPEWERRSSSDTVSLFNRWDKTYRVKEKHRFDDWVHTYADKLFSPAILNEFRATWEKNPTDDELLELMSRLFPDEKYDFYHRAYEERPSYKTIKALVNIDYNEDVKGYLRKEFIRLYNERYYTMAHIEELKRAVQDSAYDFLANPQLLKTVVGYRMPDTLNEETIKPLLKGLDWRIKERISLLTNRFVDGSVFPTDILDPSTAGFSKFVWSVKRSVDLSYVSRQEAIYLADVLIRNRVEVPYREKLGYPSQRFHGKMKSSQREDRLVKAEKKMAEYEELMDEFLPILRPWLFRRGVRLDRIK